MKHILRMADAFYKRSLFLGISESTESTLKKLDKELEQDPTCLDDFERVWRQMESVFSFLSKIPSPVGNPFATAIIGKDLNAFYEKGYKKETLDNFISHILDAVPLVGYGKLAANLGRVPTMVEAATLEIPRVARPTFINAMNWFSRNIRSRLVANGIAYGAYASADAYLDAIKTKSTVWVIDSFLRAEPKVNFSFSEIKKDPSKSGDKPSSSEIDLMRKMSKVWIASKLPDIQSKLDEISSSLQSIQFPEVVQEWSERPISFQPIQPIQPAEVIEDSMDEKFPILPAESFWMQSLQRGNPGREILENRLSQIDSQKLDDTTTKILKDRAIKAYQKAVLAR